MAADVESLLAQTQLFRDLSAEERHRIAGHFVRRTFRKGAVLFHKASTDRTLFLIASGRVRIYLPTESGRELTLDVFGPGEAFGELALLDGGPRSATAQAVDDVVTYSLHHDDFARLLNPSPLVGVVIRFLTTRLRHANEATESLAVLDVSGRLARCLIELADRYGQGREIDLTQTDLASIVGATRESVNRALAGFRQQSVIDQHGQRVLILKPDVLRQRIQ